MDTQVKITLAALNSDILPCERVLNLHPDRRTIQIGRASKSLSKGLQASADNAWFDSPVMSRDHAELSLHPESNAVTIQDIGSMHGTFVNNLELKRKEPRGLSDGDVVVFGAEVRRGLEVFPACAFRINYEFLPFKTSNANTYAFPDSDEDDYEVSDDDFEGNEMTSSEDGVSIESPPLKASQVIQAIDLTRDDSPMGSTVPEKSSIGETAAEKLLLDVTAGRPADIHQNADGVSLATYAGNSPILVESDDEDAHFSSASDDESDEAESEVSDLDGYSGDEQEISGNEDAAAEDHAMDTEQNVTLVSPARDEEQPSNLGTFGIYRFSVDESQPIQQYNLLTPIEPSENIVDDDDDESDFGLSEAGAEGIRALFDDGLLNNAEDIPCFELSDVDEQESESVIACEDAAKSPTIDETVETPKHVAFACMPSEKLPEMTSSFSPFNENAQTSLVQPAQVENAPNESFMSARQPSPSDAALMKAAIPSTDLPIQTANPIKVHHLTSQDWRYVTAQSLGDRTGKHAFFAAREDNKAMIQAGENNQPEISSGRQAGVTMTTSERMESAEKRRRSIEAARRFRERRRQKADEGLMPSDSAKKVLPVPPTLFKAFDYSKFLDKDSSEMPLNLASAIPPIATPHHDSHRPNGGRATSPEFDMTSAVMYNESKASISAANKSASSHPGRSGFSIHDIIEGTLSDQAPKTLKRKADDISDVIEKEVRIWASSSPVPNVMSLSTDMPVSASQITPDELAEVIPVADMPERRPSKRLRKIVESVGYVALGGATIFGALVLSAPDFL